MPTHFWNLLSQLQVGLVFSDFSESNFLWESKQTLLLGEYICWPEFYKKCQKLSRHAFAIFNTQPHPGLGAGSRKSSYPRTQYPSSALVERIYMYKSINMGIIFVLKNMELISMKIWRKWKFFAQKRLVGHLSGQHIGTL